MTRMTKKQKRMKKVTELDLVNSPIKFVIVSKLVGVRGEFPDATVCDVQVPGVDPWFRIYVSIESTLGYLVLFQEGKTIWREFGKKAPIYHRVLVTTPVYQMMLRATEEYLQKATA